MLCTEYLVYLQFILISMMLLIKIFLQVYKSILIQNQTSAEGKTVQQSLLSNAWYYTLIYGIFEISIKNFTASTYRHQ